MNMAGKTILVVDDEPEIREFLRFILEREGFSVIEAGDGYQGMEILKERKIDLLFTDLVMPGKEGMETIMGVKSKCPDLKIIAMSGALNNDTYLRMAQSLGAQETLKKPFGRKQVVDAVGRILNV